MNSLRARIVATLVLSIICVVGIATATLFWLREGRAQKEQNDYAQLVSEAILLVAPLFGDEKGCAIGIGTRDRPATPGIDQPAASTATQSRIRSGGCRNAAP
jgi:hypothetical protein